MQTFVPYPNAAQSASVLDDTRLNKQIIECLQIHRAIRDPDYGWQNHPAVNMWRGHECALVFYAAVMTAEWTTRRQHRLSRPHRSWLKLLAEHGAHHCDFTNPPWWGGPIHETHRSQLIRKRPEHYGQLFEDTPDGLEYHWPDPITYDTDPVRELPRRN